MSKAVFLKTWRLQNHSVVTSSFTFMMLCWESTWLVTISELPGQQQQGRRKSSQSSWFVRGNLQSCVSEQPFIFTFGQMRANGSTGLRLGVAAPTAFAAFKDNVLTQSFLLNVLKIEPPFWGLGPSRYAPCCRTFLQSYFCGKNEDMGCWGILMTTLLFWQHE